MEIVPFGDRALRFPLPAAAGRALLDALRAASGVIDVVLAEDVGAVILAPAASLAVVARALVPILALAPAAASASASAATHHTIHVTYDGEDLPSLAAQLGLSEAEIVGLHTEPDYEVAMVGFLPGFAYLRGLDPRLVVARRAEPRKRVPPGSLAIAAEYTGIYPFASPGGWHLLGRATDHRAFDASGATLAVGDRVRFERTERSAVTTERTREEALETPRGAQLEITKAQGPAIVVDSGRFGHMHEGVPHGGAMVPEALASANRALGNAAGAAALEIYGVLEVVARGGRVTVADDVRGLVTLEEGEAIAVATEGKTRVRYLAIEGGIDVPVVLGGRGTLLVAGMGGYRGRGVRRGDRIAGGNESAGKSASEHGHEDVGARAIEVLAGPDAEAQVLEAMLQATFRIGGASDRIGTRLEGPALPAHSMQSTRERRSRPMVRGAIEMTPSGLVVLGPDHPTTGGYPVIAVVASPSLGRLLRLPVGAPTRFALVSSPSAGM